VAIGEAFRRIRDGYLDVALAGGAEALLVPAIIQSWIDMKVLCKEPGDSPGTGCRPFSADRSGFALAEGAAVLVLGVAGACVAAWCQANRGNCRLWGQQ